MLLMSLVGTAVRRRRQLLLVQGRDRVRPRSCAAAIFERVAHFSVHQFDRFSTASLITRTTNDTTQVQQVLIMMLTMVDHRADDGDRRRDPGAVAGRAAGAGC